MHTNESMKVAKSTNANKECIIRGKDKPWMHNKIKINSYMTQNAGSS